MRAGPVAPTGPGEPVDAWPLACPVCDAGLSRRAGALACPAGHSYDVAREGYANLLAAQHRERGIEGDTAEMLRARRRFLEAGYYRPLRDRLIAEAAAVLDAHATAHATAPAPSGPGRFCVAELGCGEGYYIGGVAEALGGRAPGGRTADGRIPDGVFVGLDVSKAAARLAARRYGAAMFVVANLRRKVYLETASADVVLNVFAPRNAAEFARVARPGGRLVVVIPGESHLAGLRAELGLLGIHEAKEERVLDQLAPSFELAGRDALDYEVELPADAVADLVAMGPNRWHRPEDAAAERGTRRVVGPASAARQPSSPESGARRAAVSFIVLRLERRG